MYNIKDMVKAILFDADGVVLSGRPFSEYLEKNYRVTKLEQEKFFKGVFKQCLIGKADLKNELPKYLKKWGWKSSVEDFLEKWFITEDKLNTELVSYIQVLRNKNIKCYIATNQEKRRINYMINKMRFNNLFDGVFASCFLGFIKPDRFFFKKILADLKDTNPNEVVFLDDSSEHVNSARDLGINAQLYSTNNEFKKFLEAKVV